MARPFEPLDRPIGPFSADSLVAGAKVGIWTLLTQIWRNWRDRRALRELYAMPDRQLADIGLDRADVTAALMTPLTESASTVLRIRALNRRAAVRANLLEAVRRSR